jgi:mono/diheme cytochrome c family protein
MAINCAFCHAAIARTAADAAPVIYPGGASNTVDVFGYQAFLTACARDPRFTADVLLPAMQQVADLSLIDRLLYRYLIIPATQKALLAQGNSFAWTAKRPAWGPGRIDPFNPVKFGMLGLPDDGTVGNSVMEPVWGLDARDKIRADAPLHWDGLNTSVHEVIVSSALGDGATAGGFNWPSIARIEHVLRTTAPPPSPFKPEPALVQRGEAVFTATCAACHGAAGPRTLTVIPLAEIGTDRHRVDMWTVKARDAYTNYRDGYDWGFKSFQKREGYVAEPLDAVWLRGPFLHNGSVPTIADLLEPPAARPKTFVRGSIVIDQKQIGYQTTSCAPGEETPGFCFDTSLAGNSNAGHDYGTGLAATDKSALLAYLLTL